MTNRDYVDRSRRNWQNTGPRPLRTVIWYPAMDTSTVEEPSDPQHYFVTFKVAPDAGISNARQTYPLILLSHGSTSVALAMEWLGHYLASRGYIAAAVEHHGNTFSEGQLLPQGFWFFTERVMDLTTLLDTLLADNMFGEHIDRNRIGVCGYSAGGTTAIQTVGAVFLPDELKAYCKEHPADPLCLSIPENSDVEKQIVELAKKDPVVRGAMDHVRGSHRDDRVKGAFAVAPAMGGLFLEAGLKPVKRPVFIVAGQADNVTPVATNAQRFADLIGGARLEIFPGGVGHMTFGSECTSLGKQANRWCNDPEGVDRASVHRHTCDLAYQFFEGIWKESGK